MDKKEKILSCFPFAAPREGQIDLIERVIKAFESGKKHVILNAPTGWGKSVMAYTVLKYFGGGFILTSQKCLQEQYLKDLNIPYIMGRVNYKCQKNNLLTCDMGDCKRDSKKYCKTCPYLLNKANVFSAEISDLNYSYFLIMASKYNNSNKILRREILVCDECHNLESQLLEICSLNITSKFLTYLGILISLPGVMDDEETKVSWLINRIRPKAKEQKLYFKTIVEQFKGTKITKEFKMAINKLSSLEKLISAIDELEKQYNENGKIIISMADKETIEFKPLFADKLFNRYISDKASYILHMSATILSKNDYCRSLGLNPNDVEYIQTGSLFPLENRIIYYNPIGSLSYKNKAQTIPKLIIRVRELLEKYNNVKGIIHTVNYTLAEILIEHLGSTPNGYRLLMPRGPNRQEILTSFYESDLPYVLVSPSLTEGLDLKDDLSRFCIICKVPYANIADIWTKERMNLSNSWYLNNTAQTLVQMTGRSIRSETDHCDTYILDKDFINFAVRAAYLLPDWWKESVKEY